jgi:hypothetical protein
MLMIGVPDQKLLVLPGVKARRMTRNGQDMIASVQAT